MARIIQSNIGVGFCGNSIIVAKPLNRQSENQLQNFFLDAYATEALLYTPWNILQGYNQDQGSQGNAFLYNVKTLPWTS